MEVCISVEGIKVWARHGVYASERLSGRYFIADVEVKADLDKEALMKDDLSATCNYELINRVVHEKMAVPAALLEKKALEIAEATAKTDSRIFHVRVKLSKLSPPLGSQVEATAVTINWQS